MKHLSGVRMARDSLKGLSDLLDQERKALLSGDLTALSGLSRRKELMVQRLASEADAAELMRLEAKLTLNGELLAAAAEGLKAGIARLRVIATPPALSTYDGRGIRRDLPSSSSDFSRRA